MKTETEEIKMVICPRCGAEIEEGDLHDDHCNICEDWFKCEHCGAWTDPEGDGAGDDVEGEIWCRLCFDNDTYWCEHCEEFHTTSNEVHTGRRTTQNWCDRCVSSDAWTCNDCNENFADDQDYITVGNERVCDSCSEDGYIYCCECEEYRRDNDPCDCNNRCEGVADYGDHGNFVKKNTSVDPKCIVFGAEMEIYSFGNRDEQKEAVARFYKELGHDFAFPTEDGSLDDTGVEFITHPMSVVDWMTDERLDMFMDIMAENGAETRCNSGCHLTADRSAFVSEDALKAAIVAVTRFRTALLTFSESQDRGSYCLGVDLSQDPLDSVGSIGKYSCVNVKRREDLVEFRTPGMTLDVEQFRVQIQLYANMIHWSNTVASYSEAFTADWKEVFMPVIGDCSKFAESASAIGELKQPIKFNGLWKVSSLDAESVDIHGIPCFFIGTSAGNGRDHDSLITVDGGSVEVGDCISDGITTGIAKVRATGFTGIITRWKDPSRDTSNVVGGSDVYTRNRDGAHCVKGNNTPIVYFEFAEFKTEEVVEAVMPKRGNCGEVTIFVNQYGEGSLNSKINLSLRFDSELAEMFTKLPYTDGCLRQSPIRLVDSSDSVGYRPKFDMERKASSMDVEVSITRNGDDGIVTFEYNGNVAKFAYINSWGKF